MNPFAGIFLDATHPIQERYQMLANHLDFRKTVLITNIWNELKINWPIEADVNVESDPVMAGVPGK